MDEESSRRDRLLAARIGGGDAQALEELYDAYATALYRHALAIVGCASDAEDVLQEVFLKLVRRRGGPIQELRAYLFTAARHEAFSVLRRRQREARTTHLDTDALPAAGCLHASAARTAVRDALQALPSEQREVVVLKIYEQLTFEEIGRAVRASANTVASRYRYAIKKLRQALGDSSHGQ
jgi:RNA polymerase sigma-70 factor, ECF subfamily